VEKGDPGTLAYRVYLSHAAAEAQPLASPPVPPRLLSPWHDVPFLSRRSLPHSPLFHYVNEIPRGYGRRGGRALATRSSRVGRGGGQQVDGQVRDCCGRRVYPDSPGHQEWAAAVRAQPSQVGDERSHERLTRTAGGGRGCSWLKHGPVLHNYGCLPQTWEDPTVRQTSDNLPGARAPGVPDGAACD
jgi:hypothetical protein